MTIPVKPVTAHEFIELAELPENADKRLELIDGVIYEVTSNSKSSACAIEIIGFLKPFIREHKLGHTTGADGGYTFNSEFVVPDFAFVSYEQQKELPDVTYNPIVPDFALEVISPTDLKNPAERIEKKRQKYLAANIRLLWMAYPTRKTVEVFAGGKHITTAGINDMLDGRDVFPGLAIAVRDIF